MKNEYQYVNLKEACVVLGVTRPTFTTWRKKGYFKRRIKSRTFNNLSRIYYHVDDLVSFRKAFINEGGKLKKVAVCERMNKSKK